MKGIIFAEFLDMVEQTYGLTTVDKIIITDQLPSGGAYTAAGTYDFAEMVQLISNLSQQTNIEISVLLKSFGKYFFNCLKETYPHFFIKKSGAFDFLRLMESHIHSEVKKL